MGDEHDTTTRSTAARPGPDELPAEVDRRGLALAGVKSPARSGRLLGRLAVAAVPLAVIIVVLTLLNRDVDVPTGAGQASDIPALQVDPAPITLGTVGQPTAAVPPPSTPDGGASPARGGASTLADWADRLAGPTGIPARALQAYGLADLLLRRVDPGCHFSWVTVAGLGRIESDHGRFHGASVHPDGEDTPPVVGVPLDGTDGNATLVGADGTYTAALGPLQFLPSTWARWGTDTHGDGRADINNIDDAAVTAARYLCADGHDLATGPGWRAAVLSYNASEDYARRVYAAADAYAHDRAP